MSTCRSTCTRVAARCAHGSTSTRGQADAATVDLALVDVALRLAPTVEPLAFSRIEGRLSATRRDDRITRECGALRLRHRGRRAMAERQSEPGPRRARRCNHERRVQRRSARPGLDGRHRLEAAARRRAAPFAGRAGAARHRQRPDRSLGRSARCSTALPGQGAHQRAGDRIASGTAAARRRPAGPGQYRRRSAGRRKRRRGQARRSPMGPCNSPASSSGPKWHCSSSARSWPGASMRHRSPTCRRASNCR